MAFFSPFLVHRQLTVTVSHVTKGVAFRGRLSTPPDEKGQTCSSNCLEIKGANNFFSVFELFKGILAHQAKWWKLFHPPLK